MIENVTGPLNPSRSAGFIIPILNQRRYHRYHHFSRSCSGRLTLDTIRLHAITGTHVALSNSKAVGASPVSPENGLREALVSELAQVAQTAEIGQKLRPGRMAHYGSSAGFQGVLDVACEKL
ncbi:MAG: hypothetical protein A4E62_01949 [Syntrophorhabdus sp. PtaU1.Bin002]|nr:MAG: hypothetical protein A4E62_01949 [Syntrophorhabdus sp. PtaU1.Bin002]